MNDIIVIPKKSVFQIYITEKTTNKVLLDTLIIAYSESEAIEGVKVGSVIKELGLERADVDFYIKITGDLYEGKTFAKSIDKTPILTNEEVSKVHAPALKAQAFLDNLPSWSAVSKAVDNISNLTDAKVFLRKLARIVYWLAKNSED